MGWAYNCIAILGLYLLYAKGKGWLALTLSALILTFLFRQAFSYGALYIDVQYPLELLLWLAAICIVYQNPRQIAKALALSVLFTAILLFVPIPFFFGML